MHTIAIGGNATEAQVREVLRAISIDRVDENTLRRLVTAQLDLILKRFNGIPASEHVTEAIRRLEFLKRCSLDTRFTGANAVNLANALQTQAVFFAKTSANASQTLLNLSKLIHPKTRVIALAEMRAFLSNTLSRAGQAPGGLLSITNFASPAARRVFFISVALSLANVAFAEDRAAAAKEEAANILTVGVYAGVKQAAIDISSTRKSIETVFSFTDLSHKKDPVAEAALKRRAQYQESMARQGFYDYSQGFR